MSEYYAQKEKYDFSSRLHFWCIDGSVARRVDLPSEFGTHRVEPGEEILTTLKKQYHLSEFHKLRLAPGEYFPRMARPSNITPGSSPGENPYRSPESINNRTTSTGQLHALIQELQQICQVVHPTSDNFDAYGHEIRNILIIACTEVETHWKNILKANGARAENRHDYAKLSPAMKLDEYRVSLPWYPWLEPISPFESWMPCSPAEKQNLPWYDAYNAVKHDRENSFARATLANAFKSLTGCFVMLCAQYGWDFARRGQAGADAFFQLTEAPKWTMWDIYVPPFDGGYKEQKYPFSP